MRLILVVVGQIERMWWSSLFGYRDMCGCAYVLGLYPNVGVVSCVYLVSTD